MVDKNRKNILLFGAIEIAALILTGIVCFKSKHRRTVGKEKSIDKERLMKNIVSKTLTSHTLEDAVKNVSAEIGKLFDADRVHFRFYDASINTFSKVIEEYRKDECVPSAMDRMIYPKEFNRFLCDKIFTQKEILFINDPNNPQYPESFRELFRSLNIKHQMIVPILYNGNPEGAFFVTNTEDARDWSKKDIEEYMPIFQQISIGTHLFKLNDSLIKASNYDRILREIINEVRRYGEPEEIFRYLLYRLTDLFHIDRVLDLKMNEDNNLYVFNEQLKSESLGNLKNQILFFEHDFQELTQNEKNQIITINDVSNLNISTMKNDLMSKNIQAFLLYPITEVIPELKKERVTNRIMLCSSTPRLWTAEEINALKLIVGTLAVIFVEIRRRKEVMELRNQFLATLTHDLRSPILAEQKALEAILSKRLGTSLENYSEYLEDISGTNEDLLRTVNNILTIQHIDSGMFILNLEQVNLKSITGNAVKSINFLAKEKSSIINENIQDSLPAIKVDKDEISRVIVNLISNAIKHNPKGTEINIFAEIINKDIKISVSDNGEGIPEEERSKIFQRYPTEKRKIGTGLGLYLSKQIIEAHKGRIWFETEEGKGTTFYFTLPNS